jgi:hypothetical protein
MSSAARAAVARLFKGLARPSHIGVNLPNYQNAGCRGRPMPSLFRFLFFVGFLAATAAGGLYIMAEFFEPVPKDISQTVPGVKIRKQ